MFNTIFSSHKKPKDSEQKPTQNSNNSSQETSFFSETEIKEAKPQTVEKKPVHNHSTQNNNTAKKPQHNNQKQKSQHNKQASQNQPSHHRTSRPNESVSLEPRDMQQFVLLGKGNPKNFPYLTPKQSFEKHIPHLKEMHKKQTEKDTLRIIPFGGMEQVGLNCIGFEYNNEILIVDMGIQFPDEHSHGIQGKIPDLSYTKGKKIAGIIITHGHIDHIGAIPQLMRALGAHVPIFAPAMAKELIASRQEDFKIPLNLQELKRNKIIQIATNFYIEPFTVDHSIPDSFGIRIHTPVGKFIHTGDWKFDSDPRPHVPSTDHELLKRFGKEGVRALLSDSTNAHLQGSSMNENVVIEPLTKIFNNAEGRIITGTFSSIIERLQIIVDTATKFGRKVVLLGRGMNTYFDIAYKLGYIKIIPGTIITMEEADKMPDHKVCICCTGAQGERYAAMMRIATGESKDTEFKPGDSVVLSSSVIPGNERRVQELMDLLYEQKVIVHHYRQSAIHAGGHAREEDIKQMIEETKPEFFIPIYGNRFQLYANAEIAKNMGVPKDKIMIARNGQIIEFKKESAQLTNIFAPHKTITIDGALVGFTTEKEFLERYQMSRGGILILNIIPQKGDRPKVYLLTHGFLDFTKIPEFKSEIIELVKNMFKEAEQNRHDRNETNRNIRKKVQSLIWQRIQKEPVVMIAS